MQRAIRCSVIYVPSKKIGFFLGGVYCLSDIVELNQVVLYAFFQMLTRSRALFIKEYNNKLFNWLVIFSLVMVVIGRFVVRFFLLEIVAWVMFAFLETYTRLFWSSESLYYNPVWHIVVSTWETIVYNPFLDLDR